MTLLLVICVVVIISVSVYLILGRELKEVAMGLFLLSHGAHLAILSVSGQPLFQQGESMLPKAPPVLGISVAPSVDPLPQALILTSIVISFAVVAFMLTLLVMTYRKADKLWIDDLARDDQPILDTPGEGA
ncbi:MAG: sodium:proton antiporter [Planctomycetota bacterium]|jgi:multicomponent Na+:H+ antiporter subunit C